MARRITRRQALITGLTVAGGAVAIPVLSRSALGAEADLTGIGALVEPGELPWDAAKTIVAETALPMIPAAAIDACSAAGGGHVIVPSGTYVTGAIRLKNNVDLHLNSGAVLKFSGDASKFPTVLTRYEGIECMNRSPMIYALGQHDISVTGSGTLDAANTSSWNKGNDRSFLEAWVAEGRPVSERIVPGSGHSLRSSFVEPYNCDRVLIQ